MKILRERVVLAAVWRPADGEIPAKAAGGTLGLWVVVVDRGDGG